MSVQLRTPQARALNALTARPVLNRYDLAVLAGFNPTTGTLNRVLNGIRPGSSSGDAHEGIIALGLVRVLSALVDGEGLTERQERVYQITAAGEEALAAYLTEHGDLPPVRDAESATNKRYIVDGDVAPFALENNSEKNSISA